MKKLISRLLTVLLAVALLLPLAGCGQKSAYKKAVKMLRNYKLEDVVAAFDKAGDYEDAPMIKDMYQKYIDRDYKAASDAFFAYYGAGHTTVTLEDWIFDIRGRYNTDTELFSLIGDIYRPALRELLGGDFGFACHSNPLKISPTMTLKTANATLGGDLDTILAQCGTAANGKTIICFKNDTDNTWYYGEGGMSMGLTAMLPEEAIPASLAEVEYVVLIAYTENVIGTYNDNTKALTLTATVTVARYPRGEALYDIGAVTGGDPLSSATKTGYDTYGHDPDWEDVAALLDEAVNMIYQ
jgi:hypothetical protein